MSLLAELLSKAKGALEGGKDVPPELKNLVHQKRRKQLSSGLFVFLGLLTVCSAAAGFWAPYYLNGKGGPVPAQTAAHVHVTSRTVTPQQEQPQPMPAAPTGTEEKAPALGPEGVAAVQTVADKTDLGAASGPGGSPIGAGTSRPAEAAANEVSSVPQISREEDAAAAPTAQAEGGQIGYSNPIGQNDGESSACIYSAMRFEEQMKYPEALSEYRNALKYSPESALIFNNISSLYVRMGVYENALQYAEKALASNDAYVPAMVNSGISLAGLDRYEKAGAFLERAVASEPYNRNALYNLGLLYEKQGKFEAALATYQDLLNAGDDDAYLHMGRVLELSGRKQDAINVYLGIVGSPLASASVKKDAATRLGRLK